jgi:prepilin-type N-terminal cleavage/methylation domain-containing protein
MSRISDSAGIRPAPAGLDCPAGRPGRPAPGPPGAARTVAPAAHRSGFTLIELLVVILVISILASLLLVAVSGITTSAQRRKTAKIEDTIRTALAEAIANLGSPPSPAEHPLAGSLPLNPGDIGGRFPFYHVSGPAAGTLQPTTGLALTGVPAAMLGASDIPQLMLPDDLYDGHGAVPFLYGLRRDHIGIMGAVQRRVTQYMALPMAPAAASQAGSIGSTLPVLQGPFTATAANPYASSLVPTIDDLQHTPPGGNVPDYGKPDANQAALTYVFRNSDAMSELSGSKALYSAGPTYPITTGGAAAPSTVAPTTTFLYPINAATVPTLGGAADPDSLALVYTDCDPEHLASGSRSQWQPGYIRVTPAGSGFTISTSGSTWVRYRLPGLAVYDAWGDELLYSLTPDGGIRLMSAGADGVMCVEPGADAVIDSPHPTLRDPVPSASQLATQPVSPTAQLPLQLSGDDRDGWADNVMQGPP